MRMTQITAAVLVIEVLVMWVASDSAPQSPSPQPPSAVINVTQTQIRHHGFQRKWGDNEFWLYQLHNRRITQAAIGYSTLDCDYYGQGGPLGSGVSYCRAAYSLAKGKIMAHGLVKDRSFYVLSVTGGTGLYTNFDGQVLATMIGTQPHVERLIFGLEG